MFENLINKILGLEREPMPNRQETVTAPDVIEKAVSSEPVPKKYQRDIEALRQKYGDAFKTGLCINLTLQEALSIMPRVRRRRIGFIQRFAILFDERMGYNINDQISKN